MFGGRKRTVSLTCWVITQKPGLGRYFPHRDFMKKRYPAIQKSLLLLFLLNLLLHPAFHEYRVWGEFFATNATFDNHHHEDLMTNEETDSTNLYFFTLTFFANYPPPINHFQQVTCHPIPSLISNPKAATLRC